MSEINRNNYEAFFLDYHEGQLSTAQMKELEQFLLDHPDLKAEFDAFEMLRLPTAKTSYPDKTELLKKEEDLMFSEGDDYRCIAFLEGDMKADEEEAFRQEVQDDQQLWNTLSLYNHTRLSADEKIRYRGKSKLKKQVRLIPAWVYPVAAAAVMSGIIWAVWPSGQTDPLLDKSAPLMAEESRVEYQSIPSRKALLNESKPDATLHMSLLETPTEVVFEPEPEMMLTAIQAKSVSSIQSNYHYDIDFSDFRLTDNSVFYAMLAEEAEYETVPQAALRLFRERVLNQNPEEVKNRRFNLWELADVGLERFNDFAGTSMDITRNYNTSGELELVSFNSRLVDISTPLRSNARTD